MQKLLVAIALLFSGLTLFAQEIRIGRIDTKAVFEAMPENLKAQQEIDSISAEYQVALSKLESEYQSKVSNFLADKDNLLQSIQEVRMLEIDQLQQRIQNFREMAAKDLQSLQESKTKPILERINKAIQAVGDREEFVYIYDSSLGNILYYSPTKCVDILPLVKAELGIE